MDIVKHTDEQLRFLASDVNRLREKFFAIMDCAPHLSRPGFPLPGISLTQGSNSILISYGGVAVDLLLSFSRMQDGRLIGRITAFLTQHPLVTKPVKLDWFTFNRQGIADFTPPAHASQWGDEIKLSDWDMWMVLTLVESAITYQPED